MSVVKADPRHLSPSEAMQYNGQPIIIASASQASITSDMNLACASASSRLHVPDARKGRELAEFLSPDKRPIENTVA